MVTLDQRVARLTLNRPAARNALTRELWSEIADAVVRLDRDEDVAAVVLTGADPAFCAGFDLRRLSSENRDAQRARQQRPPEFLGMLPPRDTPIIAAVNGPAVTGGLELALGCDFLIASDRARFADTHARVGVMPGGGLTVRLPALIGPARALQMSMTGDFVDAQTACRWGLVNEVVPHEDLLDRATGLARSIASIPRSNIVELRQDLLRGGRPGRERCLGAGGRAGPRVDAAPIRPRTAGVGEGGDHRARQGATVKVYSGMDPRLPLADVALHAGRVERMGYDGLHVAGDRSRLPCRRPPGGAPHPTDRGAHECGTRLRKEPNPHRLRGLGPGAAIGRSLPARARHTDPAEHRGPLRDGLGRSDRPDGRPRPCAAGALPSLCHRR